MVQQKDGFMSVLQDLKAYKRILLRKIWAVDSCMFFSVNDLWMDLCFSIGKFKRGTSRKHRADNLIPTPNSASNSSALKMQNLSNGDSFFQSALQNKASFLQGVIYWLASFFDIGFSVEVSEIPLGLEFCFLHNSKWICFSCCTGLISYFLMQLLLIYITKWEGVF